MSEWCASFARRHPAGLPIEDDLQPPHAIDWKTEIEATLALDAEGRPREALVRLVAALRSATPEEAAARFDGLCAHLAHDGKETGAALGGLVRRVLHDADCAGALTDSGIPRDSRLVDLVLRRLGRRLLPEVRRPGDLRVLLRDVFHDEHDYRWLDAVPVETWRRLLGLLGITAESVSGVADELSRSIRIVAHHAASMGLGPYLRERLHDLDGSDTAFLDLSHDVLAYLDSFDNEIEGDEDPLLDRALATVARCREAVLELRRSLHRFGSSLRLTTESHRLLLRLERLDLLLHLSEPVERDFPLSAHRLVRALVEAENTRNHFVRHVRRSADLLAFQVVEHAARKGAGYITTTWKEYNRFLVSSLGGGLIVAVFALFKVLLGKLDVSLAGEAFLYGTNYAVCFVLIYLTGSTLATKQPAMTASAIARSMGDEGEKHKIHALADLIVRVARSQFVSLAGNLVCALPAALLLSLLYEAATGEPPIDTAKAGALLDGLHPWRSGALFYAAIAGVFLFAAGLVSGWVDNRNVYARVPERVAAHPVLRSLAGPTRAQAFADAVDRHLGALAGNVFLGFALGSAGTIGVILGLPFDIRHIAFGASQFGMAVEALHGAVPLGLFAWTFLGVAGIGALNFLVSFSLALSLALESRTVSFGEGRLLVGLLVQRLVQQPWQFFAPPWEKRKSVPVED